MFFFYNCFLKKKKTMVLRNIVVFSKKKSLQLCGFLAVEMYRKRIVKSLALDSFATVISKPAVNNKLILIIQW